MATNDVVHRIGAVGGRALIVVVVAGESSVGCQSVLDQKRIFSEEEREGVGGTGSYGGGAHGGRCVRGGGGR